MTFNERTKPIAAALLKLRENGPSSMLADVTLVKQMQTPDWTTMDTVEIASWAFDIDQEISNGSTVQQLAEKYQLTLA